MPVKVKQQVKNVVPLRKAKQSRYVKPKPVLRRPVQQVQPVHLVEDVLIQGAYVERHNVDVFFPNAVGETYYRESIVGHYIAGTNSENILTYMRMVKSFAVNADIQQDWNRLLRVDHQKCMVKTSNNEHEFLATLRKWYEHRNVIGLCDKVNGRGEQTKLIIDVGGGPRIISHGLKCVALWPTRQLKDVIRRENRNKLTAKYYGTGRAYDMTFEEFTDGLLNEAYGDLHFIFTDVLYYINRQTLFSQFAKTKPLGVLGSGSMHVFKPNGGKIEVAGKEFGTVEILPEGNLRMQVIGNSIPYTHGHDYDGLLTQDNLLVGTVDYIEHNVTYQYRVYIVRNDTIDLGATSYVSFTIAAHSRTKAQWDVEGLHLVVDPPVQVPVEDTLDRLLHAEQALAESLREQSQAAVLDLDDDFDVDEFESVQMRVTNAEVNLSEIRSLMQQTMVQDEIIPQEGVVIDGRGNLTGPNVRDGPQNTKLVFKKLTGKVQVRIFQQKKTSLGNWGTTNRLASKGWDYDFEINPTVLNSITQTVMSAKNIDQNVLRDLCTKVNIKTGGVASYEYAVPIISYALEEAMEIKLHLAGFAESKLVKLINDVNAGKLESKITGLWNKWVVQKVKNVTTRFLGKQQSIADLLDDGVYLKNEGHLA